MERDSLNLSGTRDGYRNRPVYSIIIERGHAKQNRVKHGVIRDICTQTTLETDFNTSVHAHGVDICSTRFVARDEHGRG